MIPMHRTTVIKIEAMIAIIMHTNITFQHYDFLASYTTTETLANAFWGVEVGEVARANHLAQLYVQCYDWTHSALKADGGRM